VSSDGRTIADKLSALRELQAEKQKREQEASAVAYQRTIAERGTIPWLILDEPDKDAQLARLLAELGNPEFCIAHTIVAAPEYQEEPPPPSSPAQKQWVDQSVARPEAAMPSAPPKGRNNAGVPPEIYAREVKRLSNFLDGDFDPNDLPIGAPIVRKGW